MWAWLLVACSGGRISGEVDGATIDIDDAVLVQLPDAAGGQDVLRVFLGGTDGDLCAQWTELESQLDALDSAAEADALAAWWADTLPPAFWQVDLQLRVDDLDTPLTDARLDGSDWPFWLLGEDEAAATFVEVRQPLDAAWFSGEVPLGDLDDYLTTYTSDGGSLEIRHHTPGEHLRGAFATRVVALDGREAGEVELTFSAYRCESVEPFLN